jgi:hypothetical protein
MINFSDAFNYLRTQIKIDTLSENEKIFLNSLIYVDSYIIFSNSINKDSIKINRYKNPYETNVIEDGMKSISKIYNMLEDEIKIGKIIDNIISGKINNFDYFNDVLRIFYINYLNKSEKENIIHLLNVSVKGILIKSISISDIEQNLSKLARFFNTFYYLTNGDFKYENILASYIANTNSYEKPKMFYNILVKELIEIKNSNHALSSALNDISNILASNLKDFNRSMAKLAFK